MSATVVSGVLTAILAAPADEKSEPSVWSDILDWLTGIPLQVVIVLVAALILDITLRHLINRVVRRATTKAKRERLAQLRQVTRTAELSKVLLTQRTEQRAAAIGTLLRNGTTVTIWTVAMVMVLSMIGVNVAPLLASAGVIGVALGFGAQTLVKDYLSGIFIIIEDQFGVGDVVEFGGLVGETIIGTVEEVALRYTRLRDPSGIVWYFRNGEILRVANRSQGWTQATVDIAVAYNADLGTVRQVVEQVATDMDEDPGYDDLLLGKPVFDGVESVSGDAVVIRITAKAAPEKQVSVARTIRERMKIAFDRAGVSVPGVPRDTSARPEDGA